MKHSINKIFNNLTFFLVITALIASITAVLIYAQNNSFEKIDNLINQKNIINQLTRLQKKDIELSLIQFNGKSKQLHHEIYRLRKLYQYDLLANYVFKNSDEYLSQLTKLSELTNNFNESAHKYYSQKEVDRSTKVNLKKSFYKINSHINTIIFQNIAYDKQKYELLEKIAILIVVLLFLIVIWYKMRLNSIYQDILFLYAVDKTKKDYRIFSQEVDAIALRVKRKPVVEDNPNMIDPLTKINNLKGLHSEYAAKKALKENNFTSVTVLEIDNFSKSLRPYPQEYTQAILKKVAFTISLHQQATDIIARTGYNQFTIIISRYTKEQSFRDIEQIHKSISQIKFKIPNEELVTITTSAGYITKPNNQQLDESIKQAKELLEYAKTTGKNNISQTKDLATHNL